MKKNIQTLAALLMAVAGTTACSSEDDIAVDTLPQKPAEQTYTMTVEASKGSDATSRALSLDGKTLNATWAEGDVVEIWSSDGSTVNYGELTAQSAGQTTTLTGTLTGIMPTVNLSLLLKYRSNDYSSQTGTLDYIAQNCDYATARVKVTSVSGSEITTTAASFENQQAIVKFTLKDSDGTAISAWKLTVSDGTNTYTVTPASDTSELFVAIPGISSQTLTLTANAGSATYTYEKSDVTFTNGQYYAVTVKMAAVRTLAEATTSDYGKVVCAAGHLHDAKTAVPAGCTAVGILGKVTETGHGLILALQDATKQNWNTINGWTSVDTYAGTTLKVLPDDGARGANLTSYTKLGETAVSNWAVAQKSDYEAIFINLGSTTGDEEGTTYDGNVNAYITTGVGGTAISGYNWSATMESANWAFDFESKYWNYDELTTSLNVRPVLGFGGEATPALSITSPSVGQVIGSDGKNYAYGSLPTGVTAVAKICYVSGSNGLALALTDEGKMNWSTAIETCAAHTPAFTGGTWKLASKDEWSNMISYAGSYSALRDGFSSVGGTNMQSDYYWSSTEGGSAGVWDYDFDVGYWYIDYKGGVGRYVRACLAF